MTHLNSLLPAKYTLFNLFNAETEYENINIKVNVSKF